MVTIKTLKDFVKRSFPHLTDEEIETARIIINSKAINHYVPEECLMEPQRASYGEVRILIDVDEIVR